jgi:hypothetical protein
MKKESTVSDFKTELKSLAEIEVLENEEMWSSRIIDEDSRKQPGAVIILKFPLQNNPAKS